MEVQQGGLYVKKTFIKDLFEMENKEVISPFYIKSITSESNGNGNQWLKVVIQDRTGTLSVKVWSENIKSEYLQLSGKIAVINGKCTAYKGMPDIAIKSMQEITNYEMRDYMEMLDDYRAEKCIQAIRFCMDKLTGKNRAIADCLLYDEVLSEMKMYPYTLKESFSFAGGLLVHTADVCLKAYYQTMTSCSGVPVDREIVLLGAMLHGYYLLERYGLCGLEFKERMEYRICGVEDLYDRTVREVAMGIQYPENELLVLRHIIRACADAIEPGVPEAMVVCSCAKLSKDMEKYEMLFKKHDLRSTPLDCDFIKVQSEGKTYFRLRKEGEDSV